MNRTHLSALVLAVAALAGSQAMAADASAPKTRNQVKAELAQATRLGNIVTDFESGQKANELSPGLYPAKPAASGKTRAEVQVELAEAIRTGNILVADGEILQKANALYPQQFPAQPVAQAKTREQVKAELVEAVRNGDILADNESGLKLNQLYPQRYGRI